MSVANAGPDQLVSTSPLNNDPAIGGNPALPDCCKVNGRDSYDPFDLPLTYSWTIVSEPSGSMAGFAQSAVIGVGPSTNTVVADFVPDLAGDYVLQLVVNDGYLSSTPSYVHLSTNAVAPRADAGWNKTITAGQTVQLDDTHSVNPMNCPLTYAWSFVSSPAGSNANMPRVLRAFLLFS